MILLLRYSVLFVFILAFNLININNFSHSYYDSIRYYKGIKSIFTWKKIIIFLSLLTLNYLTINNFYLLCFSLPIFYIYIIYICKLCSIHFTRRSIILLITNSLITFLLFFKFIVFYPCVLIFSFALLPISNFLLLPYENKLQRNYIKAAKNKLNKYHVKIIGITGSFGKTTFKNYLYHLLKQKYHVLSYEENYNTLMGICKFINNSLNQDYDYLIIELGIDKNHGMLKFKQLLSLDIGVIVGVGKVHLSTFKNYENIINSKCEIDTLLKNDGILLINSNYQELNNYHFKHKVLTYKEKINHNNINTFQQISLNGVITLGKYLMLNNKQIEMFLNNLPIIKRRFEIKRIKNDIIINDSYNINFNSFIEDYKYMKQFKLFKIIITGGLIEQGKDFYNENVKLSKLIKNIDLLILITKKNNHPLLNEYEGKKIKVKNINEALKEIKKIKTDKIILISAKGEDYYIN